MTNTQGNTGKPALIRSIGGIGIGLLALNSMIGAGIFALPSVAASQAGNLTPWLFLAIGVLFLIIVARKVWRGDYDTGKRGFFTSRKGNYEIVETMGLYWHFVDLVWVFIFAFFYLW